MSQEHAGTQTYSGLEWANAHKGVTSAAGTRIIGNNLYDPNQFTDITSAYTRLDKKNQATFAEFLPLSIGARVLRLPPQVAVYERIKLRTLDMIDPDKLSITTAQDKADILNSNGLVWRGGENVSGRSMFETFLALQGVTAYLQRLTPQSIMAIDAGAHTIFNTRLSDFEERLSAGSVLSLRPYNFPTTECSESVAKKRLALADAYSFGSDSNGQSNTNILAQLRTREAVLGDKQLRAIDDVISKIPSLRIYHPRFIEKAATNIMRQAQADKAA